MSHFMENLSCKPAVMIVSRIFEPDRAAARIMEDLDCSLQSVMDSDSLLARITAIPWSMARTFGDTYLKNETGTTCIFL